MEGTLVHLEERETGKARIAHVSQLARFKAIQTKDAQPATSNVAEPLDVTKEWDKVTKGTKIIFHIQKEPASYLRLGEVLEYDKEAGKITVWFYIHGSGNYDVELPMGKWMATPEWYDENNKSVVYPKPAAKAKLYMRDGVFSTAQIDLIAAGISLQRGKIAPPQVRQVDTWLKRAATKDARALRVVNEPG